MFDCYNIDCNITYNCNFGDFTVHTTFSKGNINKNIIIIISIPIKIRTTVSSAHKDNNNNFIQKDIMAAVSLKYK